MTFLRALFASAFLLLSAPLLAQPASFTTGPVFTEFGPVAGVDSDETLSPDIVFQVSFDVAKAADPGTLNRSFETAARFINMHVAAGVPRDQIKLAIVVHGGASFDLTRAAFYGQKRDGAANGSSAAIAALQKQGVTIYLCGQSAAYHGIAKDELLPGVKMSLSAMTAHALLQQQGYTLNPF